MNRYDSPVQNSLESYVPIPLDGIAKAGQAVQQRWDTNEAADAQANSSLSNVRAVYSGQQSQVQQLASQYRSDAGDLLKKYSGYYDDPGYKRDQQNLILKYSNNPIYSQVNASNQFYDANQKQLMKLQADGHTHYDPTAHETGVDANGRIRVPTEGVRRLTYAEDVDKMAGQIPADEEGGVTSNEAKLDNYTHSLLTDPANSKYLQEATLHQIQMGVPPEQAPMAAAHELKTIVDLRKYHHIDPDKVAAQEARLNKVAKPPAPYNMPNAEAGESYDGVDFHPAGFTNIFPQKTNILVQARSTIGTNREMKPGEPLPAGAHYSVGQNNSPSLNLSTDPVSMGEKGGTELPPEVVGVVNGQIVAIAKNGDKPDGTYSNAMSEQISHDSKTGLTRINHGIKGGDQEVTPTAMRVFQDAKTGDKTYFPMGKDESIGAFRNNFSGEGVTDYSSWWQDHGNKAFKQALEDFGFHKDFFKTYNDASVATRKILDRLIGQRADRAVGADGKTNIQRNLEEKYGDQGKRSNIMNPGLKPE